TSVTAPADDRNAELPNPVSPLLGAPKTSGSGMSTAASPGATRPTGPAVVGSGPGQAASGRSVSTGPSACLACGDGPANSARDSTSARRVAGRLAAAR